MVSDMFDWIEATQVAISIRQSAWLYPILEIFHLAGIVLLVGSAMMFDFRLLGFSKLIPVDLLANHLLPWARNALFFLVIPSGLLLFISNASTTGLNPVFWIKLASLFLAIMNSIIFHQFTFNSFRNWNQNTGSPAAAKAAAIFSIVLWMTVIACGRLIAYY